MTLNNISWTFSKNIYTDIQKFNEEVTKYQNNIYGNSDNWKPDEIVFDSPEIQIQYMAWVSSPQDLLENEYLIEEEENVFEEYPDEEEYQVEIVAKLKADNGECFTALEFLMKSHNQQANKELGDHVFFEGVDDDEPEIINDLPTYYIECGS
jgi:hypothetical protein